jgi:GNAT superfamily N-acetyltransferase
LTLRARLHTWLWRAGIQHNNMLVLRKHLKEPPPLPPGFTLEELRHDDALVRRVSDAFDRRTSEAVIQARFGHGLSFHILREEGRPVASTWIVPRGERFVEEIGLGLAVAEGTLWLRDVFVAPAERGRGLFALLLNGLHNHRPATAALWSDLRRGNRPSLHAHLRYGFDPVARFEVVHLWSRCMIRLRWPRGLPAISSFKGESRLLRTGEVYRAFVVAHRA